MQPTRRAVLGFTALTGMGLLAGCRGATAHPVAAGSTGAGTGTAGHTEQVTPAPTRHAYGSDPSQWAELYRPASASRGTVVVIHGGFWRSEYGADLGTPLAKDLAARGWTAYNIEYRRIGDGGGWPTTLDDVAAAIDQLAGLGVGSGTVLALGHSAGGQLAAWAASRARPKVRITGVVSQAGVLDLTSAALAQVGGSAVPDLLGGEPDQVPDRYRSASPQAQLPAPVPVRCVHARADLNVPYAQSEDYVRAARAAGGDAALTTVAGDHFSLIDPSTPAWRAALTALAELAR